MASASLFYLNIGDYEKADQNWNRAYELGQKNLDFESPENMRMLETLSIFLRDAGAYDVSNEMLEIKKK